MRARRNAAFAAALATFGLAGMPSALAAPSASTTVIVEARSVAFASDAVNAAGGHVDLELPLVSGVAAHVDGDALAALQSDAAVTVMPDVSLHPTSASFDVASADTQVAAMDPGADLTSDAGRGVAVAIVDTGVADSPDLAGRLVRSPDFSGEGDGIDRYGHGTFMAGLIAGDGSASAGTGVRHAGLAPGATIVSVKVAGADGSTTVSRVIAGIGWVVTHADALNIRVLNLSFGVGAPMPYLANPLDAASEAAWASGITVVTSAGNEGQDSVTSPGNDPYVLTVGATDTHGTAAVGDDTVASWSGTESFHHYSKPEVVAPGVSVISLRAPGSTIDLMHPEGRVGDAYFRGTGTSMSTAIVAGAAAVLVSHHLGATPDDVKGALVGSATTIDGGARAVDLAAADQATAQPDWWQHHPVAFGGLGVGLHDGMPWTSTRWTADTWESTRWTTDGWDSSRWTSSRWTSSRWTSSRWTSSRWTDGEWASSRWTDESFTSSRWTSSRWTAVAWPSQSWG